jgi:MFS family permease
MQEPNPGQAPPAGYTPQSPGSSQRTGPTNTKAVLAFVFGLLGIILIPFIGSIIAVVFGHMARQELRDRPEETGDGLALAGLIMGWIMLAIIGLLLAIFIVLLLIALVVFVVLLVVHLIAGEEEDDQPTFPWPAQIHPNTHPPPLSHH